MTKDEKRAKLDEAIRAAEGPRWHFKPNWLALLAGAFLVCLWAWMAVR